MSWGNLEGSDSLKATFRPKKGRGEGGRDQSLNIWNSGSDKGRLTYVVDGHGGQLMLVRLNMRKRGTNHLTR